MQTETTGVLEGIANETTQKQQEFCSLSSLPTTRLINMISGTSMFIRAVSGGPLQTVVNTNQGPQRLHQNLKHQPLMIPKAITLLSTNNGNNHIFLFICEFISLFISYLETTVTHVV